jgi:hypothetical protein
MRRKKDGAMARKVTVELELPGDLSKFRLPRALIDRLHALLDKHDIEGKLTARERRAAIAFADLSETLSYLKLQAKFQAKRSAR